MFRMKSMHQLCHYENLYRIKMLVLTSRVIMQDNLTPVTDTLQMHCFRLFLYSGFSDNGGHINVQIYIVLVLYFKTKIV